jgi:hypothetical protein
VFEAQLHQDILLPIAGNLDVKYNSFTVKFQYLKGQGVLHIVLIDQKVPTLKFTSTLLLPVR